MTKPVKSDLSKTLAALHLLEKFAENNSNNYQLYRGDSEILKHMKTEAEKTQMVNILQMLRKGCNPSLLNNYSLHPPDQAWSLNFPHFARWSVVEGFYKSYIKGKGFPIPELEKQKAKETVDAMRTILDDPTKKKRMEIECCDLLEKMVHYFVDDRTGRYHDFENSEGCRSGPGMVFLRKLSDSTDPYVRSFATKAMKDLLALEHLQRELCVVDMLINPSPVIKNSAWIIVPSDMTVAPTRSARQAKSIKSMKRLGGLRAFCTPFSRSPSPAARTDSQDTLCAMRRLLLLRED